MIHHLLSADELQRYSRQLPLEGIGLSGQTKLKNTRVLCVGLGGLGSSFLLYLTAAGIGKLGLLDPDTVELNHLQRQVIYRSSHVSSAKTAAAAEQILALNPTVQVATYDKKLTQKNAKQLISQYDIVADCSDNFETNYLLHDVCRLQKKPYVFATVFQFQGYCTLFLNDEGPCLRCLFPTPPETEIIPSCNADGVLGVVPGILGAMQAAEVIKWALGIGQRLEKRLLVADLLNMMFKEIKLVQNSGCQLCAKHQPMTTLHSLSAMPTLHYANLASYSITAEDMFQHLKNRLVTLVDVRSPEEHAAFNIGGKLIPLPVLPERLNELNPNHLIIVYCHTSPRSIHAINLLLAAGFPSVRYLIGGASALQAK